MNIEALLTPALITTALAAATGGVAKVWQLFQQGRADCLERCAGLTVRITELETKLLEKEAKLEASNQRLLQTSMTLERLLGKYERERGHTSSQPPKST
jgi:hypothetical protein